MSMTGQEEIIAGRYAAALAERAAETGGVAPLRRGLRLLAGLVNPRAEEYSRELADFLESPRVGAEEKIAAAGAVADKLGLGGTAGDFFRLLVRHGRAMLLPRIEARFGEIAGELTGERAGVVETAMALSADQLAKLEEALAAAFGAPVRLRQRVNPELLAGAKITVGDKTIDGSVLGKWRRLRDRLSSGVSEECVRACDVRQAAKEEGESA